MELLRIMTAGSVDDGKSTLIGRLLYDMDKLCDDHVAALQKAEKVAGDQLDFSLVTDGLRAEREQKITIDVAYRYLTTARRRFIIADAPGHEQYTRNMATAASQADLAVLLVDARQGVLPQSKRHAFICAVLGVPRLVVAVNKMDLIGFNEGRFWEIEDEYRSFAVRLGLKNLCFIPVCAVSGDNLLTPSRRMPWYNGSCLLPYLEEVYVAGDRNLIDFRMPIQRVIRSGDDFRGYSGTIASGIVRVGDELLALPSGFRTRATGVYVGSEELEQAVSGQAVTITLDHDLDICRGDLLVHPGNIPHEYKDIEAMVVWTGLEPLLSGMQIRLRHGCRWVKAQCSSIHYRVDPNTLRQEQVEQLQLNDIGRVRFHLFQPIFGDSYQRNRATGSVVIVSISTNETVGAATIVERTDADADLHGDRAGRVQREVHWHAGQVTALERESHFRQRSVTLWLTGLSGSGKSTLAFALERKLLERSMPCYVLDGDNIRHGLNRDLGFSPIDRSENIRRVAEVARLMNDAGLIMITSFISPYQDDRRLAQQIIGTNKFIEVYVNADISTCEQRDPKGLYQRARSGELPGFTGVSSPYEIPDNPDVIVETANSTVEESLSLLLELLQNHCHLTDHDS